MWVFFHFVTYTIIVSSVVREVGGERKILEEGHGHEDSSEGIHERLMTVDEAKEVCRDRRVWRSVLSDYPARDKA